MIQRIQSVYLLLVSIILILVMCLPFGTFTTPDAVYEFTALSVSGANLSHSTWGLFALLLMATLIAFITIFLYRNRILQIRLSIFNSLIVIGYYIAFWYFMSSFKSDLEATFNMSWTLSLPLIALIFNYLAIRGIGKDEVLVKASQRIR
ncbi:MAG: DUF4293 domain-containing protein [Bacteroides sp.]|nr:DUF4293 domain-containing protein [Bacteroides sp.]MDD2646062.1 DUF4293 domain-containing protein [Bacteroides sp.]MDD4054979.1 DUF4293 domain-containing protein [Bacteroides sp.]MDD4720536.1 DUF4293 domain-containing protein [Bacteroides sp.]